MGLHMIKAIKRIRRKNNFDLNMRIGIHSGSVLCGVLGLKKWQFDVWSNDVTMANHLESGGLAGRVHVSEATAKYLGGAYELEPADGHLRDGYIRQADMRTYFIKQTEPTIDAGRRSAVARCARPRRRTRRPAARRRQSGGRKQLGDSGGGRAAGEEAPLPPPASSDVIKFECDPDRSDSKEDRRGAEQTCQDQIGQIHHQTKPLSATSESKPAAGLATEAAVGQRQSGGARQDVEVAEDHANEPTVCNAPVARLDPNERRARILSVRSASAEPNNSARSSLVSSGIGLVKAKRGIWPEVETHTNGTSLFDNQHQVGEVVATDEDDDYEEDEDEEDEEEEEEEDEEDEEDDEDEDDDDEVEGGGKRRKSASKDKRWRPEIPFMHLYKLDVKPVGESISAQLLNSAGNRKSATVSGGHSSEILYLREPKQTAASLESDNLLSVPKAVANDATSNQERASRSMNSLLRRSFRRSADSKQLNESGVAQLQEDQLGPIETHRTLTKRAQSSSLSKHKRDQTKDGVESKNRPTRMEALRRTYYRSFTVKSRNEPVASQKALLFRSTGAASSHSQGSSDPGDNKKVSGRRNKSRRLNTQSGPIEQRKQSAELAGLGVQTSDATLQPLLSQQTVERQLQRSELVQHKSSAQSPTVCIKIETKSESEVAAAQPKQQQQQQQASERPSVELETNKTNEADHLIIVSCPTSGDGQVVQSVHQNSLAPSVAQDDDSTSSSRCRRRHSNRRSDPLSGRSYASSYVLLFLRLFFSKMRQTGCCGFKCLCCWCCGKSANGELDWRHRGGGRSNRPGERHLPRRTRQQARDGKSRPSSRRPAAAARRQATRQCGSSSSSSSSPIEVEISRRMMKEHINWFRLTFKSQTLEDAYCQIRYTTSKSNIVYIFVTWLLMALVAFLSLPNHWNTIKIILIATLPLSAFACFYMSDSILYNRYMNYKLKEAAANKRRASSNASQRAPAAPSNQQKQTPDSLATDSAFIEPTMKAEQGEQKQVADGQTTEQRHNNAASDTSRNSTERRGHSSVSSSAWSYNSAQTSDHHYSVAPLVHRVAKFWSKLDRIPMIWNIFIFTFNLIMIVAFLEMITFECIPDDVDNSNGQFELTTGPLRMDLIQVTELTESKFQCVHMENLIFGIILIMIEMGSFFRSSYLRKVALLSSMSLGFVLFLYSTLGDVNLLALMVQYLNLISRSSTGVHSTNNSINQIDNLTKRLLIDPKWTLMNVAYDYSSCPLLFDLIQTPPTIKTAGQERNQNESESFLRTLSNMASPRTLASISKCDPNMIEKGCVIIVAIFLGLVYVCRSNERISRLDFLWKLQASKELQDMRALRHYNTQLLENILPDHVAAHFLQDERNTEELYAKSYPCVAVLFASIPNFSSFYSEDINNGMECIRLLNEIIFDFDQLLENEQFKSIEKVKTISSTYLAACGLNPRDQSLPPSYHLSTCCSFAFAMKRALQEVNVHSFNNFVMRVGISHGPLVGGVIGAKKPVFDIWGDTVNEASRMDSTGTLDMIQVPKRSAVVLASEGFLVQCRGIIQVKGKGEMETYYVLEKSSSLPPPQRLEQQMPVATCKIIEPIQIDSDAANSPNESSSRDHLDRSTPSPRPSVGSSSELSDAIGADKQQVEVKPEVGSNEQRAQKRVTTFGGEPAGPRQHQLSVVTPSLSSPDQSHSHSGESLQRRRLNRYSRTAQSLREPSAMRRTQNQQQQQQLTSRQQLARRLDHSASARHRFGNDLEMGEMSLGANLLASSSGRHRPISPLDLATRDRILQLQKRSSNNKDGSSSTGANQTTFSPLDNSEENSLTAVVYNLVQMRKSYDPTISQRLNAVVGSQVTGQQTAAGDGGGSGSDYTAHNQDRQHLSLKNKSNDLNSEAVKFVAETLNDPLGSALPISSATKRFKHASMIARSSLTTTADEFAGNGGPRSLASVKRKGATARLRSSLFRRRTNYRRTGTSAVSDYGTTEPSINELD